jgi:trehalose-6-phosphate synthase
MLPEERQRRADRLRRSIEQDDINRWLGRQIESIEQLNL